MTQPIIIDSEGVAAATVPASGAATGAPAAMIGQSPAMKRIQHMAMKIAPTDSNVLITGETGTGKEMLARAIHALSPRHNRPFVAVNASAIPENLQESELFGHRKGAFTGAVQDRKGLFEEASSGTLFLDEIGDTSPQLQVKLLRALESRVIRRVGDGGERAVDVRVLAATNRDLVALVKRGEFREDLFFRLNVVQLHLPPLRERGGDIALFLETFLRRYCQRHQKNLAGFDPEAMDLLGSYLYPGNIRELDNIVHHAVLMAEGPKVTAQDLPPYLLGRPRIGAPSGSLRVIDAGGGPALELGDGFMSLADMEKNLIEATLAKLGRNQSVAAKKLGISRSTLWRKMKEYGIEA
jgi:DNA-binding NtrC family response regulator